MEKPGTPSSEQSEKAKKYDRQLRLWGDNGQTCIENASVCLINGVVTGTETLKSLILSGLGSVTIVDDHRIIMKDLGNNFFLESSSVGAPRGEVTLHLLLELNPDVRGTFVDQCIDDILANQYDFFNNFTVVIAAGLSESSLLSLSKVLWEADVPLVIVRSYGMIGYIRIQLKEHTVVESHPDSELPDLRLDRPFDSFCKYADSLNLHEMDHREYSHVPYVIILYKYLEKWKAIHNSCPVAYKEKKAFIETLKQGMKSRSENGEPEENFEEAIRAVNTALLPTCIPKEVKAILDKAAELTPSPMTPSFWVMARALQEFIASEGKGALPVRGVIPDMTSDSEKYIRLHNIYNEQASLDSDWIYKRVQELLMELGPRKTTITETDVRHLCKNAHALRVIYGKSLADEYKGPLAVGDVGSHLENPDKELVWYVLLRAVDQFHSEFRAYPGYFQDQVESDIVRLKVCVNKLLSDWGCGPSIKDDYIHEMCRFGASEIHSVASYIGACAAHEIIKLITAQYVPINNTYIYNAITSSSSTFRL